MSDTSSSNIAYRPSSLVGSIQEAGLVAASEVERLQDLAASVQQYRFETEVSRYTETTRSTALWSAMRLNDQLRTSLEDSKVSMAKLTNDLSLATDSFTTEATTTRLHDDFADAMALYLGRRTISGPVGLGEVVLAILRSARDSKSGVIGKRLGNVDVAIARMEELTGVPSLPAFDPTEFSDGIRELRRGFKGDPAVTPGRIATELQVSNAHGDYAGGRFVHATFVSAGTQALFEVWCSQVRGVYDMELVRTSRHHVIDGRLFLIGLAGLDDDFAVQLEEDGMLDALRSESEVPIRTPVRGLEGGVSSEYVDPGKGISLKDDRLGVATYVWMLAHTICDKDMRPPLSVGVFGEWGSGKSFFMGLLRGQIDEITHREDDRYVHDIRQIGFNAWHYADTNLWASLGDEIFRQLLQEKDPHKERQESIRAELDKENAQRQELEAAAKRTEAEARHLRTQVTRASTDRDVRGKDLLAAIKASPRHAKSLQDVWHWLGIADPVEQAGILAAEVRGTVTEAAVIRRSLADRGGLVIVTITLAVVLGAAGFAVWESSLLSVVQAMAAAVSAVLATAVGVAVATRRGITSLHRLMDEIGTGAEQASADPTAHELAGPLQALRDAEAARDLAQAQLAIALSRAAELGRELSELAPGQRLYNFLAERIEAGDYSRSLGLVSTIRKDFEHLAKLMNEWQEERDEANRRQQSEQQELDQRAADDERSTESLPNAEETTNEVDEAKRPIDRIVLYIDDLDRCSPRQVVEVLQAVHLLMAFDLFVVVVGVDPRWLVRSLQEKYPKLLDTSNDHGGDDGWDASPEDYLEKIFGIPLVLPGMASGTLDGVLRGIMKVERQATTEEFSLPVPDNNPAMSGGSRGVDGAGLVPEKGSQVAALTQAATLPPLRPLSDHEIRCLAALEPLVGTPREAKRLANVYRMVRATRGLSVASRFMGDDGQAGEHEAVVLLLGLLTAHARLLGAVLDSPADNIAKRPGGLMSRAATEAWSEFASGMEPRGANDTWSNDFVPAMTPSDRLAWHALRAGLEPVTELVSLPDLTALQRWAPHVRRFSFVMSPEPSLNSTNRILRSADT